MSDTVQDAPLEGDATKAGGKQRRTKEAATWQIFVPLLVSLLSLAAFAFWLYYFLRIR